MNIDERNIDPIQEILRVSSSLLDLDTWGFKESYRSIKNKILIYDSEWCRFSITWGGWDPLGGNSISIHYGRLHAPDEKATMIWNGEMCHCWHREELALHFLDGHSPSEMSIKEFSHPLTEKFYEKEFRESFHRRQPEWLMSIHQEVWDHYGRRLFELFDLRQSNLWDQYRSFLKEFYDTKGRISFITPPMDKVC